MLHVGLSVISMFNGNFNADCAVRPPSRRVAVFPDDESTVSFCDRMAI